MQNPFIMMASLRIPFLCLLLLTAQAKAQSLTAYVNPFIGTAGHGHTYPGATVPFGMVQLSPDNGTQGWDWCSGYNYSDSMIAGFSHMHLSGTGIGDWCDISVMPYSNLIEAQTRTRTGFSHANESASPGYYQVRMNSGVNVALTATDRCGFHHYEFPAGAEPVVKFNLGFHINWDTPEEVFLQRFDEYTVTGYRYSKGWAQGQRVYFAARTSMPIKEVVKAENGVWLLRFAKAQKLDMKLGLSTVSEYKARLALGEIQDWDFERVRLQANLRWERELSKIQIKTGDRALKTMFYTALYHTCLAPVLYCDADGSYQNANHTEHKSKGARYTVYSLWDTFRALNPLFTITQPERYPDILNSMMSFYRENGLLPVWDLSTWETNTMTGYHAIPVLADALLKKTPGVDPREAYEAMKKSAMQNIRGTDVYRQYGYVPQDKYGSSVTVTLEYAYDDWCIAQVAKMLGGEADYQTFMKRSNSWKALYDAGSGFLRARNADGSWVTPFDPFYSEHDGSKAMYTEGNAWQHSFFVPQDVPGLIRAHGGDKQFIKFLDDLFSASSKLNGANTSPDVSGLIGQYAHGNEPSHHIAYLYTLAGAPRKSQDILKRIVDSMYHAAPDGYSGNEDCGQMSAWLVWTMMGMYPVNPASGEYVFGLPMLDEARIILPGEKEFLIRVSGHGHVKSMKLNGRKYTAPFLKHGDLIAGGLLEITLE